MEGHQRDRTARVVEVVRRGHEARLREEVDEGALGVVLAELLCHRHKLLDVLGARLILRVAARPQRLDESGLREQRGQHVRHGRGVGGHRDLVEDRPQPQDRSRDLGTEPELVGLPHGLAQRDARLVRMVLQSGLRCGADPPLRGVHDPTQGHGVGRVGDGDEVPHRVLDLGPLVELGASEYPVGQGGADEHLLECSRLGVRAIEHRDVAVLDARLVQRRDLVGDELRLVVLAVSGEADDFLAVPNGREELLVLAVEVVRDDRVRRAQDVLGRAVVLLEQHDLAVREVPLELGDIADVGTTERVDGLVRVADDSEGGCRDRPLPVAAGGRVLG